MAFSRVPFHHFGQCDPFAIALRTPGSLGYLDAADPTLLFGLSGDSPGPLGLNDLAAPFSCLLGVGLKPPPDPNLSVTAGQVTFDAEGNDDDTTAYFSRVLHWPKGESGVTLGRGYDMRHRTEAEVKADLVAAGLDAELAAKFAKGHGKSGEDARLFVKNNKTALGPIPAAVQKALFERIYPTYVARARKSYDDATANDPDAVAFDELDPALRDVLVDLVYQGFKGAHTMRKFARNDFDKVIKYITGSTELMQYEAGRHRVDYLSRHAPAP